jgi:hypothetical protein
MPEVLPLGIRDEGIYGCGGNSYPCNPVESLSGTKLRFAIVAFVSVALIIFGTRLDIYVERVGNHFEFIWWIGYGMMASGWALLILLLLPMVSHLDDLQRSIMAL